MIRESSAKVAILEMSAIPDIEYTALRSLISMEETLRSSDTELWLAELNPEVLRVIERSSLGETLGDARIFPNLREAVRAYEVKGDTR
jgi:anti-anti-sigma regulatory factor